MLGRSSHREPTKVSHPRDRSPGPDPTQVEGRILGLLRHRWSQQRPNRSHQRNHRTRQTHRQRLPQPHQLPTPNAPHHRRPRRLHPHPTRKNQQCARRPCATRRPPSCRHQHRASGRLHRLGTPSDRAGYTTTSTDSAQPLSPNLSSTQYLLSPGQAHLPAARKTHTPTVAALRAGEQRSDRPPRLRDHFGKQNAIGTVVD